MLQEIIAFSDAFGSLRNGKIHLQIEADGGTYLDKLPFKREIDFAGSIYWPLHTSKYVKYIFYIYINQ